MTIIFRSRFQHFHYEGASRQLRSGTTDCGDPVAHPFGTRIPSITRVGPLQPMRWSYQGPQRRLPARTQTLDGPRLTTLAHGSPGLAAHADARIHHLARFPGSGQAMTSGSMSETSIVLRADVMSKCNCMVIQNSGLSQGLWPGAERCPASRGSVQTQHQQDRLRSKRNTSATDHSPGSNVALFGLFAG